MQPHPTINHRPQWRELQSRFGSGRECLASYLALEAAEVIAGVKPANLFAVSDRAQGCGHNLYRLWQRHGMALLATGNLAAVEMRRHDDTALLLVYRPEALAALLRRSPVAALLRRSGYQLPLTPQDMLAKLRSRLRESKEFPHEIGVILGYPLKDVAGFMQLATIPLACNGPWKIYGNPQRSLELAETFRRCRQHMACQLAVCQRASSCLDRAADNILKLQYQA